MFSRPKGWIPGLLSKPKNPHSLEHLKYLHGLLCKNQTVTEHNRSLLVETLRSISEILIWGDQNDSTVFDFFLEKNMLSFFLRYLQQKSGRYICVQLLQTLNILFENISNETSLYYLLSNNHINSIIVHKFDFSDEEVMAYYISFLKTLSFKLNRHTIHFFYNEHTNDFALYTEAIKFFNHSEAMVRIAVRTITLNVYKALSPASDVFSAGDTDISSPNQNSTDEEKLMSTLGRSHRMELPGANSEQMQASFSLENRPYLEAIFNALECSENDYEALFALCLLYAMGHNDGIHQDLMDSVLMPTERSEAKDHYNIALVERLIRIITLACQHGIKVRLSTLELSIKLLRQLVFRPGRSYLQDRHLACIENARECSTQLLRNFYKSEEIFLDMFEDEYTQMKNKPLNVEYLTMDASILLPPTGTPLTGIEFSKRLPCGEVERARRAIRVFFLVRDLSLSLMDEREEQLPLNRDNACVRTNDILDLNNSDLIACTVLMRDTRKQDRRFLVIDKLQMILVEPDTRRLGWGVVRFVGSLQDVEVTGDKEDSRSLHITIHKPPSSQHARPIPLLSARFIFDDHIRCMAAKQRLSKGRIKARQQKMQMIERLLDIPGDSSGKTSTPGRARPVPGRSHPVRVHTQPSTTLNQLATPESNEASRRPKSAPAANTSAGKSESASRVSQNEANVEVAEEAAAFAYQTFNQQTGGAVPKRHSPSPEQNNSNVQEIPLEDLSRNKKRHSGRKVSNTKLTGLAHSSSHTRSQSHSPKRDEGLSSNRGRSTSLTINVTKRDRSSTPTRRSHSKSSPAPMVTHSKSRASSQSSASEAPVVPRKSSRDGSSQSPKTLRPADTPALSLLSHDGLLSSSGIDAPKLLPPAEMDRIRSMSDISSTSSDSQNEGSSNSSQNKPSDQRPNFTYNSPSGAEAEVSNINADQNTVELVKEGQSSASDQLTKLAQIVHEHYRSFKDEGEEETNLSHGK
ncbi:hypothetical protein FSP39_005390 [Pinctada imbricata]|uniref:Protein CLEC16A n=1 Tax=Pinctada imbricata TaxID=66713 RepID=A0AA88XQ40_PINIB|nr:hypothetical protein FSP39_005390 [Pinctada imbricata]